MTMADGKTGLQKIAFQIGNKLFRFAINPDNIEDIRPHRTAVVKTKSRIIIQDFQSDIPTITISGSTGFNPTGKTADRGVAKIKELKKYLSDFANMGGNGNTASHDFYFHNFTNDESWVVVLAPEGVTYTQDVSSPLTYRYQIKFSVLRPANVPSDEAITSPQIGNKLPSTPTGPLAPSGDNPALTNPYDPASGNTGVYNSGTGGSFQPKSNNKPVMTSPSSSPYLPQTVNPQAPSPTAYSYGKTGLGYLTGYYARSGN
jgi:hypothetical protein